MGRKKRKFEQNAHPADGRLQKMKYKDIQRECVVRGMAFELVVSGNIPKLSSYFRTHFYDDVDHSLLDKYDDWVESIIKSEYEAKGEDPTHLVHPSLRLGYIGEKDEDGNVKKKRVRMMVKKKKKKRERTEDNVFKGTKKALAFQLQGEGLSKAEVVQKVVEAFPDANEKSIGIWFNKAKKQRANGCNPIHAR